MCRHQREDTGKGNSSPFPRVRSGGHAGLHRTGPWNTWLVRSACVGPVPGLSAASSCAGSQTVPGMSLR